MRYFFDNNLSIHLARAITALCKPEGIEVTHLRDKFPPNVSDVEWIEALAEERDWVVISQDRLTKNPHEKEALHRSGLIAFILVKGWSRHKEWDIAAQLVRWWPRIMEAAELVQGGAAFEVPWNVSGKGKFKQIRL